MLKQQNKHRRQGRAHVPRAPEPMSPTPSLAKTLPGAILETIVTRLAALFLAGAAGDMTTARQAAAQMLSAYHSEPKSSRSTY
jgi:hypothetical protein